MVCNSVRTLHPSYEYRALKVIASKSWKAGSKEQDNAIPSSNSDDGGHDHFRIAVVVAVTVFLLVVFIFLTFYTKRRTVLSPEATIAPSRAEVQLGVSTRRQNHQSLSTEADEAAGKIRGQARIKSFESINKARKFSEWPENRDLDCPICLYKIEVNNNVYELPCGHIYHTSCFQHWIYIGRKNYHNCPYCRRRFDMISTNSSTTSLTENSAPNPPQGAHLGNLVLGI